MVFVQLRANEQLCDEFLDSALMEKLGNVNTTCPPLQLGAGQLRAHLARRLHLGASEEELRAWLAPLEHEPLIFFGRMFRRFWRFSLPSAHSEFQRRYREGVQAAPEIRAIASYALRSLRETVGGNGAFHCVHMRRRDFLADHAEELSVDEYARRAAVQIRQQSGADERLPVYLASDTAESAATQAAFRAHFPRVLTLLQVFPESELDLFGSRPLSHMTDAERSQAVALDMRFGNVDQLVCSMSERFVGNKWSSFTHHVCYLREQRGITGACAGSDVYGREIDPAAEYI